jgi:hypothetical protein
MEISTDEEIIKHALSELKGIMVTVEGIKLLSQIKPEQITLILRDISSKCTNEEIMCIFSNENEVEGGDGVTVCCPAVKSVRSDISDNWFVTFSSEAHAQAALVVIKNRKFNGNIIKARLKTETANKSYFSAPQPRYGIPGQAGVPGQVGPPGPMGANYIPPPSSGTYILEFIIYMYIFI